MPHPEVTPRSDAAGALPDAMRAWRGEGAFRDNLSADADVSARLSKARLEQLFDLDHALQHVPGIVERALAAAP